MLHRVLNNTARKCRHNEHTLVDDVESVELVAIPNPFSANSQRATTTQLSRYSPANDCIGIGDPGDILRAITRQCPILLP